MLNKLRTIFGAAILGAAALFSAPLNADQSTTVIPSTGPETFGQVVTNRLNPAFKALLSHSSGNTAPANGTGNVALAYQFWVDTSSSPATLKIYDGSTWLALATIDTSGHVLALPNAVLTGTPKTPAFTGYLYANGTGGWTASTTIDTSKLSGTLQAAQFPTLGGDCTVTAGTLTTTCTKFSGTSLGANAAFGSAAGVNVGTSGVNLGRLNSNKVDSGNNNWTGLNSFNAGLYIPNATSAIYLTDTAGSTPYFTVQNDNNFVFYGTNSTGAARLLMYIGQRSNTSSLIIPVGVDGTPIGSGAPSTGAFTNLKATGTLDFPTQSVPYADLPNIPTGTALGNLSGSNGPPGAIYATNFLDTLGFARGSILVRGASGWVVRTPNATGQVPTYDGTDTNFASPGASTTLFPGMLFGLNMANNGTASIDIAAGTAASDDFSTRMTLASTLNKTSGAWTAGNGNGCLDTGTIASNWYHWFVIYNPTSGVTDALCSLSPTAPTLPSGYTKQRRIGSLYYTTSWQTFTQIGDDFINGGYGSSSAATTLASGASATIALSTPLGIRTKAKIAFNATFATVGSSLIITPLANPVPTSSSQGLAARVQVANQAGTASGEVWTDTAQQVRTTAITSAASSVAITVGGWTDYRGKLISAP